MFSDVLKQGRGGETGIRTLDTLRYTRFPSVRLQPLGHLSAVLRAFLNLTQLRRRPKEATWSPERLKEPQQQCSVSQSQTISDPPQRPASSTAAGSSGRPS